MITTNKEERHTWRSHHPEEAILNLQHMTNILFSQIQLPANIMKIHLSSVLQYQFIGKEYIIK